MFLEKFLGKLHPSKKKRRLYRSGLFSISTARMRLQILQNHLSGIMPSDKTLDYIIQKKVSISRFGDGEFDCLFGKGISYQKTNKKLKKRLLEILQSENDKCLVAINTLKCSNKDIQKLKIPEDLGFHDLYHLSRFHEVMQYIPAKKHYGDSTVTRSIFKIRNVNDVKKMWDRRDVVIVTGKNSAFNLDERLFDNLKSHKFIYGPSKHAFDVYDDILAECLNEGKDKLFLISLGPTATVLAYDLANAGYQALDIGHITNCYLEFLGEAESPEEERSKEKLLI